MRAGWMLLWAVAGGCATDVCAGFPGQACIAVEVHASVAREIDQLIVRAPALEIIDQPTPLIARERPYTLPVAVAVVPGARFFGGSYTVDLEGRLRGGSVGGDRLTGTLAPGQHVQRTAVLVGNLGADLAATFDLAGPDLARADLAGVDLADVDLAEVNRCDASRLAIPKSGPPYTGPKVDPGLNDFSSCPDAALEPNESPTCAPLNFNPVPDMPTAKIVKMAICPTGVSPIAPGHDVDVFKIDYSAGTTAQSMTAELFYDITKGDLDVGIFDSNLQLIGSDGTAVSNGCVSAPIGADVFYVVVRGANDVDVNNYEILIKTFSTPRMCPPRDM